MARGKQTCKILKEIRRQIAAANDIEYVTSECRYKGDCLGTCLKCEAEVRYLEEQLRARTLAGKAVALAGISAGMILMGGCGGAPSDLSGNKSNRDVHDEVDIPVTQADTVDCEGEIVVSDSDTISKVAQDSHGITSMNAQNVRMLIESPLLGEAVSPEDDVCNDKGEPKAPPTDEDAIFGSIEQDPQFPGGQKALLDWVAYHIVYPEDALADSIQGRVIVQCVVDSLGNIGDVNVVRGKMESLDNEAVRVIRSLPRFSPGKLNGKPVNCRYTIPVVFKLPE